MRIGLLAPLWKKVPPDKYGGVEVVVADLAHGLTQLGHEVTTFACGGSNVAGKLVPVVKKPLYQLSKGFNWDYISPYEFLSYFELAKRVNQLDIIHNHMGFHLLALSPMIKKPILTTLHSSLPPDFPYLATAFAGQPYVSISKAQRQLAPKLNYLATVYHGIDTTTYVDNHPNDKKVGFVFIGTLSKNKGVDIAIKTARQLKIPLTIAGEIRSSEKKFLDIAVYPFIDGKKIRLLGEISTKEKIKLLSQASAVLMPSRWQEAFGLVAIEAMACGSPVVALKNGALPEIITDGKTGYLAKNEKMFVVAATKIDKISRDHCRKVAVNQFDRLIMAKKYLSLYRDLLK